MTIFKNKTTTEVQLGNGDVAAYPIFEGGLAALVLSQYDKKMKVGEQLPQGESKRLYSDLERETVIISFLSSKDIDLLIADLQRLKPKFEGQ